MPLVEERKTTVERKETNVAISTKNLLFATDFSATSEAALPYATAISRRFGSTLHAAHVLSDAGLRLMSGGVDYVSLGTIYEDAHSEAKEKIEQIAARLEGIQHRTYVRHGLVWKNLAAIAEENDVDLIVVGTHGRTGLGKLLLGSVAEDILRHAPHPVLTVGPKVSGHAKLTAFKSNRRDLVPIELEVRQIICATNFTGNSMATARIAIRLAHEFGAKLTLMHVVEDYSQLGNWPGPIESRICQLKALVPSDAALKYAPETALEFGPAADRILKVAAEREADLLVLGARSTEGRLATTHLPWTTAHHVIAHASCPVLTIRS